MKKIILATLLIIFITPAVVLASWWNPISWFANEVKTEILVETSSSTSTVIPEIEEKSSWWGSFPWSKKEIFVKQENITKDIVSEQEGKNIETKTQNTENEKTQLELEIAKAKAEAEKYKLEVEKTRLEEMERAKQANAIRVETRAQVEVKEEENKNTTGVLPSDSIVEINEETEDDRRSKEIEALASNKSVIAIDDFLGNPNLETLKVFCKKAKTLDGTSIIEKLNEDRTIIVKSPVTLYDEMESLCDIALNVTKEYSEHGSRKGETYLVGDRFEWSKYNDNMLLKFSDGEDDDIRIAKIEYNTAIQELKDYNLFAYHKNLGHVREKGISIENVAYDILEYRDEVNVSSKGALGLLKYLHENIVIPEEWFRLRREQFRDNL
ncbi:MAG: hypothetical protein P9X22_05725 [Candidatus Zapsychrus exili]|nr:hypothetical protein [Candidatus Zapsychrus exili]